MNPGEKSPMDQCLHSYFVYNEELRSSCDFNGFATNRSGFVYEVVRVIDGVPLFIEEHLSRLKKSADAVSIKLPVDEKFVIQSFKALILQNKVLEGNIKCVVGNRSANRLYYAAWFQPHHYPAAELYKNGVTVGLIDEKRNTPEAKVWRSDYQQKIQQEKSEKQVFELLLTPNGKLTEGTKTNLFLIKKNNVYTAPSHVVLSGITRVKVLDIGMANAIPIVEKNLELKDLLDADAVFLTGTSPKILPVKSILSYPQVFDVNHPQLVKLMRLYEEMIRNYIGQYN